MIVGRERDVEEMRMAEYKKHNYLYSPYFLD